jgi:DNA modification methylase
MPAETKQAPWANRIVCHGEEKPDKLLANPANWRRHGESQQRALSGVLGEVGLVQSVIVNRTTGHLVDGHLRVELAIAAHQPQIPVVYVELSAEEERIILASLDPIGAMADADRDKLAELLASVRGEDEAVRALLERIAQQEHIDLPAIGGLIDPDFVPEPPAEPITKPGDLWLLGPHRLLCGDSTNVKHVKRLMAGERAALMATDPPYLVDYEGGEHPSSVSNGGIVDGVRVGHDEKKWDVYLDHAAAVGFYRDFLKVALEMALTPDVAVYQCFGMMRTEVIWQAWREVGLLSHQVVIWKKSRTVLTYSWFLWDYEVVMVGWPQGHKPKTNPPASERAVWEIASTEGNEEGAGHNHPTIKPVELIRRPITWHTKPGELIYEPFSGSGTAIIAAEQTGRICYAMELSPAFVDVACERYRLFAGREPQLHTKGA